MNGNISNAKSIDCKVWSIEVYKLENALDLINRQKAMIDGLIAGQETLQKTLCDKNAEIERLNVELVGMRGACESYKRHYDNAKAEIEKWKRDANLTNFVIGENIQWHIDKAKSEAIKEFVERLKEKLQWDVEFDNKLVFESDIDNLVKEMEGEDGLN